MPKFSKLEVLTKIKNQGLVIIFYNDDLETAKKIIDTCYDAGARAVEFTNRKDGAIRIYKKLIDYVRTNAPEMIFGAGTVIDAPTASQYINLGADYIVSPVLEKSAAMVCNTRKIPYMPGCGTLNDIHQAHLLGVDICKIFPAGEVGGPSFVKNILAPMPFTEIMATGSVSPTQENLSEWFNAGVVCVGMGSKLIRKDLVSQQKFNEISDIIKSTLSIIEKIKN